MKHNELATVAGYGKQRRVEVRCEMDAPIEKVWNAITEVDEVKEWWTGGEINPREGGRVRLGDGSELNGKIKVFQPPRIFEFTWNETLDDPGLVRFDLIELDEDRTLVTLVNLVPATDILPAAVGWHHLVERLQRLVGGDIFPVSDDRGQELYSLYKTAGIH
jgi:uncharacterized protein YndB with AHSA1/START domain